MDVMNPLPAAKLDESAVIRYDAARTAYAGVWKGLQLVRPADCCVDAASHSA